MAVANLLDLNKIKQELVVFLRNQNIFSISTRGVTTTNDTGTFSSDSTHLINVNNIKNVRNVEVDSSDLVFGTDYVIDYTYDDSGTKKCKITFTSAQTGDYDIEYDYGTDKIYPDFPRTDLHIDSYPRIGVAITSTITDENELGAGSNTTELLISVYVYANGMENVDDYIQKIRQKVLENKNGFYYLRFVTPVTQSPLVNEPLRADKIYTRTIELKCPLNIEVIS